MDAGRGPPTLGPPGAIVATRRTLPDVTVCTGRPVPPVAPVAPVLPALPAPTVLPADVGVPGDGVAASPQAPVASAVPTTSAATVIGFIDVIGFMMGKTTTRRGSLQSEPFRPHPECHLSATTERAGSSAKSRRSFGKQSLNDPSGRSGAPHDGRTFAPAPSDAPGTPTADPPSPEETP
ncbi:hypothetical protein GCM10009858_35700 [Terrabacter carboxydivorans]|uniref:Uncharacterized protein n=1 Tax=Terrabacter carboxydivorans TaxID=619730 RepID=A0ABN3M6E6_9MICO